MRSVRSNPRSKRRKTSKSRWLGPLKRPLRWLFTLVASFSWLMWALTFGSGWLPSPVLLLAVGLRAWISRPASHGPVQTPCNEAPPPLSLRNISVDVSPEERDFHSPGFPNAFGDQPFGRLSEAHAAAAREVMALHGVVVLRRALPVQTMHRAFRALRHVCHIDYERSVEVCPPGTRPETSAPLYRRRLEDTAPPHGVASSPSGRHSGGHKEESDGAGDKLVTPSQQGSILDEIDRFRRHDLLSLTEPAVHATVSAVRRLAGPVLAPFLGRSPSASSPATTTTDGHSEEASGTTHATLVELTHTVAFRGADPQLPMRGVLPRYGDAPLIKAWAFIEDVATGMSSLEVWPGSHRCSGNIFTEPMYHSDNDGDGDENGENGENANGEDSRSPFHPSAFKHGISIAAPVGSLVLMDARLVHREGRQAGRVDRHMLTLSVAGGNSATDRLPLGADYSMLPEQWGLPRQETLPTRSGRKDPKEDEEVETGGGGEGTAANETKKWLIWRYWRADLFWRDLEGGSEGGEGGAAPLSGGEGGQGPELRWWGQSDVLRAVLLEHWERRAWWRLTTSLFGGAYHMGLNKAHDWAYN